MTSTHIGERDWRAQVGDPFTDLRHLRARAEREGQDDEFKAVVKRIAKSEEFGISWAFEPSKPTIVKPSSPEPRDRPRSLGVLSAAPTEHRVGLHECAHGLIAALLGVRVGSITRFADGSGGQASHFADTDSPHDRAVINLAGPAIGPLVGWRDASGIENDLAGARTAAAELSPGAPEAVFEHLRDEAERLVREHLPAIGRLCDCLEAFDGHLAGWQLDDAMDFALQRPAPMPKPGPRLARDREILWQFTIERRLWANHLQGQVDPDDREGQLNAWWHADRLALQQEPPPSRSSRTIPPPSGGSLPEWAAGPKPAAAAEAGGPRASSSPSTSMLAAAASTSEEHKTT
ncbi:MAG: hypothetical protein AB1Z63_04815 [Candidatus Limnocylindrales bacterium]